MVKKKISSREHVRNSQTSGMVSSGTSSLDSCSSATTSGSAWFVPAYPVLLKRAVTGCVTGCDQLWHGCILAFDGFHTDNQMLVAGASVSDLRGSSWW